MACYTQGKHGRESPISPRPSRRTWDSELLEDRAIVRPTTLITVFQSQPSRLGKGGYNRCNWCIGVELTILMYVGGVYK